jgi:hypothetical protein
MSAKSRNLAKAKSLQGCDDPLGVGRGRANVPVDVPRVVWSTQMGQRIAPNDNVFNALRVE